MQTLPDELPCAIPENPDEHNFSSDKDLTSHTDMPANNEEDK